MNNKLLKITTSVLGCLTVVSMGNYCYNSHLANNINKEVCFKEDVIGEYNHY